MTPFFKVTLALVTLSASLFAGRADIMEGNPASSVKVVIYEDLQCADCARFHSILEEQVIPKYGSRVAFIFRDFPLGKHDWARPAAIAARWVSLQDPALGLSIRRELLAEQNNITSQNLKPWLAEFAARNNLNPKGIVDSLTDPQMVALVDQDLQSGQGRNVTHTPTAFLGGRAFIETIVYDDLAAALDEALK